MASVRVRSDYDAAGVRRLAREAGDADQARRLLAIAAVYDGMSREDAARLAGMDRQTLRDWVHRFNAEGADGLVNRPAPGNPRRLTLAQEAELAQWVEGGPGSAGLDHLARWRCLDLKGLILERWGVDYHERTIGKLLERMGFSHMTARPRHYRQDEAALEAFKKTSRNGSRRSAASSPPARL
jgi:transposase